MWKKVKYEWTGFEDVLTYSFSITFLAFILSYVTFLIIVKAKVISPICCHLQKFIFDIHNFHNFFPQSAYAWNIPSLHNGNIFFGFSVTNQKEENRIYFDWDQSVICYAYTYLIISLASAYSKRKKKFTEL